MIIAKLCIHESYIRNAMSFKTPYLQRWRQNIFKKFTNIKEFFYWNFFSVSWLGVFHVKGHLWRHSFSDDVTLYKNILLNINLKATRKILNFAQNTPLYIFAHNFFAQARKFDKMRHRVPHKILNKKDYFVNFSKFFWG